jgi:hypothetical protein
MKSNLFSKIDVMRIDEFSKDLNVLLGLGQEIVSKLPEYAYESMAVSTSTETERVYEEASKALGVPASKLQHAIDISEYFMRKFTSDGEAITDTSENIVSDLQELIKFDKKRREELVEYFEKIKKLAKDKADYLIKRRRHAQSALPNLKSMATVVDYRIVFDKSIEVGQSVNDYNPECLGAIPVGIIELTLSGGNVEELSFQMDKKSIRLVVESLIALEKQIDIAQDHFNLEEKTKNG